MFKYKYCLLLLLVFLGSFSRLYAQCSATISASSPAPVCSGSSTTLTANITQNTGNNPFKWTVDNVDVPGSTGQTSTPATAPGVYRLEFLGTCNGTPSTNTITVSRTPSNPTFTFNDNACSGDAVTFNLGTTRTEEKYVWDFGDSTPLVTTNSGSITHTYKAVGSGNTTFPAKVYAENTQTGCRSADVAQTVTIKRQIDFSSTNVTVTNNINSNGSNVCVPAAQAAISVTATLRNNAASNAGITSYSVDWDGTGPQAPVSYTPAQFFGAATISNPTPYNREGKFPITITAISNDPAVTCNAVVVIPFSIGKDPTALFEVENKDLLSPTIGCGIPVKVTLKNNSTGNALTYKWEITKELPATGSPNNFTYIEGTSDTSRTPILQFNEKGQYKIKLTVKNPCVTTDPVGPTTPDNPATPIDESDDDGKYVHEETVTIVYPTAQLTGGTICENVVLGQPVKIQASELGQLDANTGLTIIPGSITWVQTGGATFSNPNIENPEISFPGPGTYTIGVTFANQCQRSDDLQPMVPVEVIVNPLPNKPVNGTSRVCAGETYTINPGTTTGTFRFYTTLTGGTPVSEGATFTTPSLTANPTTYYISTVVNGCESRDRASFVIAVFPAIGNNTISQNQDICAGTLAAALTGTTPTGGDNTFEYTWEMSTTSSIAGFTTIPGASGASYTPTGNQTAWYRRLVRSSVCTNTSTSNAVKITVTPALSANTITGEQTICTGAAITLNGSAVSGGDGSITIIWERSLTSATANDFAAAPGTNNQPNYSASLTQTAWYRRRVVSGACNSISNVVKVTVDPQITNNTISSDHEICAGSNAPQLTGSTAQGGVGTLSYRWESSSNNTSGFTPASGTNTGTNYTPGALTQTTYFRRTVNGGACSPNVSNVIEIKVTPAITNNSITSPDQTICSGATATPLTGSTPTGGNGAGTLTIIWESTTTGPNATNFIAASGTNSLVNYAPGAISQTTYYRRRITSGVCSSVSNVVQVKVDPQITNNTISGAQTVCAGSPITTLTGSVAQGGVAPLTYLWESSTNALTGFSTASGTSNNQNYTPGSLTQTTYFRRTVNGGACSPNLSNIIEVKVTPAITNNTISGTQTVCVGDTPNQITGSSPAGGDGGAFIFTWEISTTSATDGFSTAPGTSNQQNYSPAPITITTWYRRKVTSGVCTSTSAPVQLNAIPAISNNIIGSSQSFCSGNTPVPLTGSAPVGGNGAYIYLWERSTTSASAGFSAAPGNNSGLTYTPGMTGQTTWYRRVVSSANCTPSISNVVEITIIPSLSNNTVSGTQSICEGAVPTPLIGTTPSGGNGQIVYRWESSTTSSTTGFGMAPGTNTGKDYTPGALNVTTYFRRVATSGVCTETSPAITVTVNKLPPVPTVQAADVTICTGDPATLVVTSTGNAYEWYTTATGGSNIFVGSTFTTPKLTANTTYYVQAVSAEKCASPTRTAVNVKVTTINATAGPDVEIIEGKTTTLTAAGGVKYEWTPAIGLSNPNIAQPIASPVKTTIYTVTVTSENGCVDTDEVTVTVIPKVVIVNTFSPNRDGFNETWEIKNIENFPNTTVEIFNRWGALVFKSEDGYKQPWDGTFKGKDLPLATYYYVIRLEKGDKPLTGSVTIIR